MHPSSTRPIRRALTAAAIVLGLVASALIGLPAKAAQPQQGQGQQDKHVLQLKSRRIAPPPGVDVRGIERAAGPNGRVHFFLQVNDLPDSSAKAGFKAAGVDLLNYVGGNTYIASSKQADVGKLRNLSNVRWAAPIDDDDKTTPDAKAGRVGAWARTAQGQVVLDITLHPDVSLAEGEDAVRRHNGSVLAAVPAVPAIVASFNPGQAGRIVTEDVVQYADAVTPPLQAHNDGIRQNTNANALAAAPYNLDGSGVTVLVYDVGTIDTHTDFGARILTNDGSVAGDHATHVGGIVGGNGANSNGNDSAGNPNNGTANQWAGMAPNVNLRSFGTTGGAADFYNGNGGDLNADFTTAIGQGIDSATMSLGNNVVRSGFPCAQLGDYTSTAILIDNIVRGSISGQQLIYTNTAGNERGGMATCGTGFSTISSPGTAKNSIVVGAVNSNDNSMTNFSSQGPTDDGRVKPDIVGPGCQSTGDGTITSPSFDDADPPGAPGPNGLLDAGETRNSYVGMCGTSMAAPAVAGGLALVTEQWRSTRGPGSRPLGHTAKAIAVHTATDLGNAGPDYQFGWGGFNAQAAVDLVRADDSADLIQVDQVDTGQTDTWTFNSDGTGNVRVTLVWSDPAATQLAANTLINNLDLRLVDPDGIVVQPLVLAAGTPGNAATAGNDTVNNVEMVVAAAKAGTWEVRVAGSAVPTGPQQYTLVTPSDSELNRRPVANAGGPYSTSEGTDVSLSGAGSSDPDGDALTYEWDFDNDGQFDDATGVSPSFTMVGQDGVYPVRLQVTDTKGAFSVASSTVTVSNVLPSFTVLASNAPKDENTVVTLNGTARDPGWLDSLAVTVNWNGGSAVETVPNGSAENVRPDATVTFTASHTYGDNGAFSATVCVADDDGPTCQALALPYDNVNPTAAIDTSGATLINGVPTFLAPAGAPIPFTGRSTDPGSDDLTVSWDFADGTPVVSTLYLVNPPAADPAMSPSIQPRDITDSKSHAFGSACVYTIGFRSVDDDGGASPTANANVIIVGTDPLTRSAGFWTQQYRGGSSAKVDSATRDCYLAIVGYMSTVFNEVRDASTQAKARNVLEVNGNGGSSAEQFDRQLLAAWLNFANGSIGYTELVDTDGNGVADTPFSVVVATAEAVRVNPVSTPAQVDAQKNILERINLRHGG